MPQQILTKEALVDEEQQFRKYQWIEVRVSRSQDHRHESFKVKRDSIRVLTPPLTTRDGWRPRRDIVLPLKAPSLCWLAGECRQNGNLFPTLGVIKPRQIRKLTIRPDRDTWTESQLGWLRQGLLFDERQRGTRELEKVPFRFTYEFHCEATECRGHALMCTDWEMGQAWRRWSVNYGDNWEAKFRAKFEHDMIDKYDTHFFVGTVFDHPGTWIIIGLFYPPLQTGDVRLF